MTISSGPSLPSSTFNDDELLFLGDSRLNVAEARQAYRETDEIWPDITKLATIEKSLREGAKSVADHYLHACSCLMMAEWADKDYPSSQLMLERATKTLDTIGHPNAIGANSTTPDRFRAGILRAYLPQYREALVDHRSPELPLVAGTYGVLLSLAEAMEDLRVNHSFTMGLVAPLQMRHVGLELGAHLLINRYNMRHGRVLLLPIPSLARHHDDPSLGIPTTQNSWDLAISTRGFRDPPTKIRLKPGAPKTETDTPPGIITITESEHLELSGLNDMVHLIHQEGNIDGFPAVIRKVATEILNDTERKLLVASGIIDN